MRTYTAQCGGFTFHHRNEPEFELLSREIFEEAEYSFDCDKSDPIILDCGSHIGLSIAWFKRRFPEARIIAFEPDPQNFELLQTNIGINGFEGVELLNLAVSSRRGTARLFGEFGVPAPMASAHSLRQEWGTQRSDQYIPVQHGPAGRLHHRTDRLSQARHRRNGSGSAGVDQAAIAPCPRGRSRVPRDRRPGGPRRGGVGSTVERERLSGFDRPQDGINLPAGDRCVGEAGAALCLDDEGEPGLMAPLLTRPPQIVKARTAARAARGGNPVCRRLEEPSSQFKVSGVEATQRSRSSVAGEMTEYGRDLSPDPDIVAWHIDGQQIHAQPQRRHSHNLQRA